MDLARLRDGAEAWERIEEAIMETPASFDQDTEDERVIGHRISAIRARYQVRLHAAELEQFHARPGDIAATESADPEKAE